MQTNTNETKPPLPAARHWCDAEKWGLECVLIALESYQMLDPGQLRECRELNGCDLVAADITVALMGDYGITANDVRFATLDLAHEALKRIPRHHDEGYQMAMGALDAATTALVYPDDAKNWGVLYGWRDALEVGCGEAGSPQWIALMATGDLQDRENDDRDEDVRHASQARAPIAVLHEIAHAVRRTVTIGEIKNGKLGEYLDPIAEACFERYQANLRGRVLARLHPELDELDPAIIEAELAEQPEAAE